MYTAFWYQSVRTSDDRAATHRIAHPYVVGQGPRRALSASCSTACYGDGTPCDVCEYKHRPEIPDDFKDWADC